MRLRTLIIGVLSAVVVGTIGVTAPAFAATVIVTPANGGTYPYLSADALTIDATTAGTYRAALDCAKDGTPLVNTAGTVDLEAGRNEFHLDEIEGIERAVVGATCTFSIAAEPGAQTTTVTSTFTVVANALRLDEFAFDQKTFYPLVRDGYRDKVEYAFTINRPASYAFTITDARGHTVYRDSGDLDYAARFKNSWNGRTRSGKPVLPGKYRATMEVTADGITRTMSDTVNVVTQIATRRLTLTKAGDKGYETSSGNCKYTWDFDAHLTFLDCRGGKFAASTFTFRIPANARKLSWDASTSRSEDDFPTRGSITKKGERIGKTAFRVQVRVTDQRATVVRGASVTYTARVKI